MKRPISRAKFGTHCEVHAKSMLQTITLNFIQTPVDADLPDSRRAKRKSKKEYRTKIQASEENNEKKKSQTKC